MTLQVDPKRLQSALEKARSALLAERNSQGHWTGKLSSSALSTATAVCALQLVARESGSADSHQALIQRGLQWLADKQNADGGWGDTDLSFSNISTTTLCWAAFGVVPGADERFSRTVHRVEDWLRAKAGGLEPDKLADAIIQRYGKDRTFSVPILTMCALSGRFGKGPEAWQHVIPLPFELAAFPQGMFAALRLPVVSYALPALIAIGQARHRNAPSRNPFARAARSLVCERTLGVLERIQPVNGGFLEATPLTSFVTMSLAASGLVSHPVVSKGVEFLVKSARADGSWAIDTNLATWVTTLSINALANDPSFQLPSHERAAIREWLLGQQYRTKHPYTGAAPGGWAWTDLPGGVPDADDTAGALLALKNLGDVDERVRESAGMGVKWLMDLQNRDGGIPTFCRGWTKLPFDKSSTDITAHALRAWHAWQDSGGGYDHKTGKPVLRTRSSTQRLLRTMKAPLRGQRYLLNSRLSDGSWLPLWFGNQHHPDEVNPVYATSRVVKAYGECDQMIWFHRAVSLSVTSQFFQHCQHADGSWGGFQDSPSSIEETAMTVEALCSLGHKLSGSDRGDLRLQISGGIEWLINNVESDQWTQPAPIGFYFAKLWYYEKLYPMIFTVGALSQARAMLSKRSENLGTQVRASNL